MGKISKTFKRVVLSAIAVVGLTGVFLGTSFGALRNHPAEAIVENESSMYEFSYENNELKLLFNANLSAYKNLNKDTLVQIKNDLTEVAKSAVFDDIQLTGSGENTGPLSLSRVLRSNGGGAPTGVDTSILEQLIASQLSSVEDIDNYLAKSGDGGAYDVLTQLYVDRYAESYAAKSGEDVDDVKADLKAAVVDAVQDKIETVYAAEGLDASEAKAQAAQNIEQSVDNSDGVTVDIAQVSDVLVIIDSAVNSEEFTASVEDIMDQFSYENAEGEKVVTIKDDIVNALTDSAQEGYVDAVVDVLKNVDTGVISEVINKVGFTGDDMVKVIDNIGAGNLVDIANQIGADNVKELLNNVDGLDKDAIIDSIKSSITVKDVLKAVNGIYVDGEALYDKDNGGLRGRTIVNILRGLPRPSAIRNWTSDSQARLSYNILIKTSLGDVDFKLTVGLFGNIKYIAELAGIIDDAFEISYKDGALNIIVKAPKAVSSLIKRIVETDAISDDLKRWAYDLIFSTVEDAYNELHNKTLEEYIELLKGVDYEKFLGTALDADFWNEKLNTNKFTNERIDKLVNAAFKLVHIAANKDYSTFKAYAEKFVPDYDSRDGKIEKIYNKLLTLLQKVDAKEITADKIRSFIDPTDDVNANDRIFALLDKLSNYQEYFDRAQGVFARLYDALPDNFKGKSLMDFYVNEDGERSFKMAGELSLNIEKVIKAITPTYGQRIVNALSSVLDKIPENITLNFEAKFTGLYKITYNFGDTTKVGLLPEGADIGFFANCDDNEDIVGWVYADGSSADEMGTDDVEVYAVYDFEVETPEDVVKTYTEQAELVVATDPEELQWEAYYELWKIDEQEEGIEFVSSSDNGKFDLTNFEVADSGTYFVIVYEYGPEPNDDDPAYALIRLSDFFDITINKKEVEIPFAPEDLVYNGKEQTYPIAAGDDYTIKAGTNKGTNAGSYHVIIQLNDPDNYCWFESDSGDLDWEWKILPQPLDKPAATKTSFEYNGSEQTLTLDNKFDSSKMNLTGNKGTNAGSYKASITLKDSNNYCWKDGTVAPVEINWTITKKTVNTPADADVKWNYTNPIPFDNNAHTVSIQSGVDATLFNITYSGDYNATQAGDYVATATLSLKDTNNYQLANGAKTTYTLSWKITSGEVPPTYGHSFESAEKTGDKANAIVKVPGDDVRSDYVLHAPVMGENDNFWSDVDWDKFFDYPKNGYIVHCAYDIHFEDTNGKVDVSGTFEVQMLVPESLKNNKNLIVLHVYEQGGQKVIEEVQSVMEGDYMKFSTNHFSAFAIAEKTAAPTIPIWPFIIIIALLVVIIILQVIILLRKKAAAAPAEEEKPEEPKEEEQPKEEPQPEPQPEPEPEPEPEEEPEEEEVEEEEEEEEPAVAGAPVLKKKRKKMVPFQRKLAKSDKDLRVKYYDLRDYIKSYGINNRISIPCDTFSLHRKRYVVVTIAGKRLKIYLAADPSKYEVTPIPVEPTRLKKYEDLPTMFKVKSDLSVKRAKMMIDDIMAAEGYERKE